MPGDGVLIERETAQRMAAATRRVEQMVERVERGRGDATEHATFTATIVCTGPLGTEDDYVDERYWVKLNRITNTLSPDKKATTEPIDWTVYPAGDALEIVLTATNLAEKSSGTHLLTEGDVVIVHRAFDESNAPIARFFFG